MANRSDTTLLPHETNSATFQNLADLHNHLQDTNNASGLTRGKIIRSLPFHDISNRVHNIDLVNAIFYFDNKSSEDLCAPLLISNKGKIPILPSRTELRWLKTMLTDSGNDFLLSMHLREKLLAKLKDVPAYPLSTVWQKRQLKGEDTTSPDIRNTLVTICQALRSRRNVTLKYKDWKGTTCNGTFSPCRLEYNTYTNRFHLLAWEQSDERVLHLSISGLLEIHLDNTCIPTDIPDKFTIYLEKLKCQADLTLTDTKNAIERCYAMFTAFDKTAFIDEKGIHHLSIIFYSFEREEIIRRILSLGPAATLISPSDMRQEIIKRLRGTS